MAQSSKPPNLTESNHIYLYRLLSTTIGCGKQTFITQVEEALESDRMTAEDLGFESTRALLEELDEFVTLKVFKGGRIYAIVNAQPAWDAALEQQAKTGAGGQGGAQNRRRGRGKTLKAVKPRRVRRETESEEAEAAADAADGEGSHGAIEDGAGAGAQVEIPAAGTDAVATSSGTPASAAAAPNEPAAAPGAEALEGPAGTGADASGPTPRDTTEPQHAVGMEPAAAVAGATMGTEPGVDHGQAADTPSGAAMEGRADDAAEPGPHAEAPAAPEPEPISLTITYDPYEGLDFDDSYPDPDAEAARTGGEAPESARPDPAAAGTDDGGTGAQHDGAYGRAVRGTPASRPDGRQPASASEPAPAAAAAPKPAAASPDTPPSAEALRSYPHDFATEVYLPQSLGGILAGALPFGQAAADVLTQGFAAAREDGSITGNRTQASFSFDLPESNLACTVRIKRRTGDGFKWAVCSVEFSLE